jgi:glycosyltransferase involved in cell wall biosynthesis
VQAEPRSLNQRAPSSVHSVNATLSPQVTLAADAPAPSVAASTTVTARDRVLVLGSLPLSAPWNGADKVMARTIVQLDGAHRYIVQTGLQDPWPDHVDTVRGRFTTSMPGLVARGRGAWYLAAQTPRARLIHVIASIRRPARAQARLLRGWGRLARRPIVHTVPSLTPETFDPQTLVGNVTVVFSRHTRDLLGRLGVGNVEQVFPPLIAPASPDVSAIEALRSDLELGPIPVLYATHLDEGSGAADAIAAMSLLPPELADARLVLALRSRPGDDIEGRMTELHRIAVERGVAHRLRFVGHVSDMPSLIRACVVTVLVPHSLAGKMDLPLVILESLALGRPVIVSDRPPITEALLGGGLSVPVGDANDLAVALTTLLADPALRERLADVGRRRVLELADPAAAVASYGRIYAALDPGLLPLTG